MPAPHRSDDTLPEGHIRLSEAYEIYYRATVPNWQELSDANSAAAGTWLCLTEQSRAAVFAFDNSHREAEREFRQHLATDGPAALHRDPDNGVVLELDRRQWTERENFAVPGFFDDFVSPNDLMQPGPNTEVRGALRPVFFWRDRFDQFMAGFRAGLGKQTGKAGRPSMIDPIAGELERWIAGGREVLISEMKLHGWHGDITRVGKGTIAAALRVWAERRSAQDEKPIAVRTIENNLRDRLSVATGLI